MVHGSLAVVLHAHLPFVRHPEHEESVEERWLFEAIVETYLPLYGMLRRLADAGVAARLTLSLTPPLVGMLRDGLLVARATRHLGRLLDLAGREATAAPADERPVARFYAERLETMRGLWEAIDRDLPAAFHALEQKGVLEIEGCAATHGFLPLLLLDSEPDDPNGTRAVRAQIEIGLRSHEQVFGSRPRGLWLPECGWDPRIDPLLAEAGIDHVVLETHALLHATPHPPDHVLGPVETPSGVVAFARDPQASSQVWSAEHGYPGDPWYRDFYRDVGYERGAESLGTLAHPAKVPLPTGLKYRRIGDKGQSKEIYDPARARERTSVHAAHFLAMRSASVRAAAAHGVEHPIVVAPYDAELFGHWWFEGPDFLEEVLRRAADLPETRPVTLAEASRDATPRVRAMPEASSWGEGGYAHVWCNDDNAWMLADVRHVTRRMLSARATDALSRRALEQAAREVLLAQASDWPFLVHTRTAGSYPLERFRGHIERAHALIDAALRESVNGAWLEDLEATDNLFFDLKVAEAFGGR